MRSKQHTFEYTGFPKGFSDSLSSSARERYDEKMGTLESDPEINEGIMRLEGQLVSPLGGTLEGKALDSFKKQLRLALIERPGDHSRERIGRKELMSRLRELRDAGLYIRGYSQLNTLQLYGFYCDTVRRMAEKGRRYAPEILREIEEHNTSIRPV